MKVQIKKVRPNAIIPKYASLGASGADVCAAIDSPVTIHPGETTLVPLGFSMAVPDGFGAFLLPRSGLGTKSGIVLGNLVGLCDSDYRGEYMAAIWYRKDGEAFTINPGDRIAQMVIIPTVQAEFYVVDELSSTERGANGFGSTGCN